MRKSAALIALLSTLLTCGADAHHTTSRKGSSAAAYPVVVVDETVATAAIKISGRAFVNPAMDLWGTAGSITRYNQSRIVRLTGYTSNALDFTAVSTFAGAGDLAVVVDGALFASPNIAQDFFPHAVHISGIPAGSHTVEIWEGEQAHQGQLNDNADQPVAGTFVRSITVRSGTLARATAANGIIATGESQGIGDANSPSPWHGWAGQLRAAAETNGWLLGYFAYGSRTVAGDGLTPAQTAQCIHDLWVAMGTSDGATHKRLLIYQRPNDYDYWNLSFFTTTPAQLATFWASTLDALAATDSYSVNLVSSFPSNPSDNSPSGTYTKADYDTAVNGVATGRSYITLRNSSAFGLVLPTDYVDNVHFNQGGHDKVFAVVRTWYGL